MFDIRFLLYHCIHKSSHFLCWAPVPHQQPLQFTRSKHKNIAPVFPSFSLLLSAIGHPQLIGYGPRYAVELQRLVGQLERWLRGEDIGWCCGHMLLGKPVQCAVLVWVIRQVAGSSPRCLRYWRWQNLEVCSYYATWKIQCRMALIKEDLWSIVIGSEIAPTKADKLGKFLVRK